MARKSAAGEVKPAQLAKLPGFTVTGGAFEGDQFRARDRTNVLRVEAKGPQHAFTFHAHRWWPVIEERRSSFSVNSSGTLHKLLTRAAQMAR